MSSGVIRVAFLGPEGSFCHQAALQQFSKISNSHKIQYCPQTSIANCFSSIDSKNVNYSVIPFENSTNGLVAFTYDLLRNHFFKTSLNVKSSNNNRNSPNFEVIGEQYVSIHHNLLSTASSLGSITKIYSHPQVWSQCSNFFGSGKLSPTVVKVDSSSTSRAAQLVTEDIKNGITTTAAICSVTASEIYGLKPILTNIEDDNNNTTRFLVLADKDEKSYLNEIIKETEKNDLEKNPSKPYVTLVGITVHNENTGVLCDVLSYFKQYNINLSTINTRPSQLVKWQYIFFIEFWGNPRDEHVVKCLDSIKKISEDLKILGSFARDDMYYDNKVDVNDTML
ncbi:prephenate dehydratase [Saccharomycopsis crataegensis]|uniref:prephenate dehydratase n=1 Tax=Saccharomycopsis crataegensis TaxID=43959 RepID=A0AAV5QQD8_9ASCO|nr:prephenate dehydratase [Saccharomycopsis crataegensis]